MPHTKRVIAEVTRQPFNPAAAIDSALRSKSPIKNPWIKVCNRREKKKTLSMVMSVRHQAAIQAANTTEKQKATTLMQQQQPQQKDMKIVENVEQQQQEQQQPTTNAMIATTAAAGVGATELLVRESFSAPILETKTSSLIRVGLTYSDVVRSTNCTNSPIEVNEIESDDTTTATSTTITTETAVFEQQSTTADNHHVDDDDGDDDKVTAAQSSNETSGVMENINENFKDELKSNATIEKTVAVATIGGNDNDCGGGNVATIDDFILQRNDVVVDDIMPTTSQHLEAATTPQMPLLYPQYRALNLDWVNRNVVVDQQQQQQQQHQLTLPSFNYLQPNQNYPEFLTQFTDENYLKTDNMAFLGLNLAINDDILKTFSNGNCGGGGGGGGSSGADNGNNVEGQH